jgi:hypothetical protein
MNFAIANMRQKFLDLQGKWRRFSDGGGWKKLDDIFTSL